MILEASTIFSQHSLIIPTAAVVDASRKSLNRISLYPDEEEARLAPVILMMKIVTSTWFFVVGAVLGSFMNVVVYRMPRGLKLGKPPSACPKCQTLIRRADNLPIIGWLRLRGRCRDCGTSIAIRYPLIELTVGLLFLALLHQELLTGGINLPIRVPTPTHSNPIVWILWYTKWDIMGLFLFHCCLMCVLITVALIAHDGFAIPRKLVMFGIGVGVMGPLIWPNLHPVPLVVPAPSWLTAARWQYAFIDHIFSPGWKLHLGVGLQGPVQSAAGAVAGAVCGMLLDVMSRSYRRPTAAVSLLLVTIGVYLGWQFTVTVAVAMFLIDLFSHISRSWTFSSVTWSPLILTTVSFIVLLFWSSIYDLLNIVLQ